MYIIASSSMEEVREFSGAVQNFGALGDEADDSTWSYTNSSSISGSSDEFNCSKSMKDEIHSNSASERKNKRIIARTGMVSSVLGKEYASCNGRKGSDRCGNVRRSMSREDMEQFLCSMLGDESDLNMGVIRDVLWHCGFDFEKALEGLLKLCGSSSGQFETEKCCNNNKTIMQSADTAIRNSAGGTSDTTSCSLKRDILDNEPRIMHDSRVLNKVRSYAEVLCGARVPSLTSLNTSELPLKVLQSLFNFSMTSERHPSTMNWRNLASKLELLGKETCSTGCAGPSHNANVMPRKDEYEVFRKDAVGHWDSMQSYYKKATSAHSKGEYQVAAYFADQGRVSSEMAQEAEVKASQDIFYSRNRGIENIITIDLHGQHVKQALHLLKAHLLFGMWISSIQYLRVITGSGIHGVGKSKLKNSVIDLLKEEDIQWVEENLGTLLIKLDGLRDLKFLESEDLNE